MELCLYCGSLLQTVQQSADHANHCYRARKAIDLQMQNEMQTELTKSIKEMTGILKRIEKKL